MELNGNSLMKNNIKIIINCLNCLWLNNIQNSNFVEKYFNNNKLKKLINITKLKIFNLVILINLHLKYMYHHEYM